MPRKGLGYVYSSWGKTRIVPARHDHLNFFLIPAIGAFASPLVCQSILAVGVTWNHFYLGSLVVSALNITFISFAFCPTEGEIKKEIESMCAQIQSRRTSADAKQSTEMSITAGCETEDDKIVLESALEKVTPAHSKYTHSVYS